MTSARARDEFPVDHADLVALVNREHGLQLELVRVFEGGEFGAAEVVAADRGRFVLKHGDSRRAAAVTGALAGLGYPVPRYLVAGARYSLQELLPGAPLRVWQQLAPEILERVVELNALQSGRAWEAGNWPQSLVDSVLFGVTPWVEIDLMRTHSRDAHSLLTRCQEIVRRKSPHVPPARDVVHFDFSPDNVLAVGGSITGVIDWDGVQVGDRLFDLATFFFYSEGTVRLRESIVEASDESVLAVYVAYLCVRQTAWSIRFHPAAAARGMVERCTAVLDEIAV